MATSLKDLIRGDVALARAIFGDERKRRLIPKLQEEGWPFFSIGRKRCAFPADLAAYARKTRASFARQATGVARCDCLVCEGVEARFRAQGRQAGWLGNLDSNQDKQSQSLLCYRYTIPHRSS